MRCPLSLSAVSPLHNLLKRMWSFGTSVLGSKSRGGEARCSLDVPVPDLHARLNAAHLNAISNTKCPTRL